MTETGPSVVYVARPAQPPAAGMLAAMRELAGLGWQLATTTAAAVLAAPIGALLDRLVPLVANAIIQRLDLTGVVLRQVDLEAIVVAALDRIDLTQIVLDRVDLDRIAASLDTEQIIDRLPILDIADYVIQEMDLPRLIRQSTGGVAVDAIDSVRLQAYSADERINHLANRIFPWRRP